MLICVLLRFPDVPDCFVIPDINFIYFRFPNKIHNPLSADCHEPFYLSTQVFAWSIQLLSPFLPSPKELRLISVFCDEDDPVNGVVIYWPLLVDDFYGPPGTPKSNSLVHRLQRELGLSQTAQLIIRVGSNV